MVDVELLLVVALSAALGEQVYTRRPTSPAGPFLLVRRDGGSPDRHSILDSARMNVRANADDQGDAYDLHADAHAVLMAGVETADARTVDVRATSIVRLYDDTYDQHVVMAVYDVTARTTNP